MKRPINVNVRDLIGIGLVMAFCLAVPLLFWKAIPESNGDLITYMLGQLSGLAAMVVGYHYVVKAGERELEQKRAENTADAFNAIKAVAQTTPPDKDLQVDIAATSVAEAAERKADEIKGSNNDRI